MSENSISQLRLFTGNRLEVLAEKLAETVRTPLRSPLDEEIVVVQSKGMERWVSMQLARHNGICANIRFPFPNRFIYDCFRDVIPDLPEQSPFDPDVLAWRIMKSLPKCIEDPDPEKAFGKVRDYLRDDLGGLKRFQLSERIAQVFDQYLLYRPEMISRWDSGKDTQWQARLFRAICKDAGKDHRPALGLKFLRAIEKGNVDAFKLPERIGVFGISSLPGFHMEILMALSKICPVNLFLMNPCMEYWGDILTNRELKKAAGGAVETEDLHLEQGNPFLASMGSVGRDFFDLVADLVPEEEQYFDLPDGDTLLSHIQTDILTLSDRPPEAEKTVINEADDSIQVHSCHGPMREIEVLHDRLLAMFAKDRVLEPADILVMVPDIGTYAPYVQAVFDLPSDDPRRIPFSISDRSIRQESRSVETFLSILDLAGGRFPASAILSILESDAVRGRFDLTEDDVDLIRRWVRDTRVRWGLDGKNRRRLGLPEFEENSWKAGIQRLLLGYAMAGNDRRMFEGILPYDNIEGTETRALGKFLEFADRLFSFIKSLERSRTPVQWSETLTTMTDLLFSPEEDMETQFPTIRRALVDLGESAAEAGFDEPVDLRTIRHWLKTGFEKKGFGFGFITGGVTFCAMLPMRSIPFKVICLVGMNSGDFPRNTSSPDFDLMAKYPMPGDRSRRKDDRYLFLETLLSAREKLYISYTGQSARDNATIPPCVPVGELLDYIEQGFSVPSGKIVEEHVLVSHPLQAFSPRYFEPDGDSRLFGYSRENLHAAESLIKPRRRPASFFPKGLSEPEIEWKTVDISELCRFFDNPARYLMNRRLGLYFDDTDPAVGEKEAFEVSGLDAYLIRRNLMEKRLEGVDANQFMTVKKAAGELPHGTVGKCVYNRIAREVEGFVETIQPFIEAPPVPFRFDLQISDFRLFGEIDAVYPGRMVMFRHAFVKPKDRIKVWIHHLVLNHAGRLKNAPEENLPDISLVAGKDAIWEFPPVGNARAILESLLQKYWAGLRTPLKFFPDASWAYAEGILEKNRSPGDALAGASDMWYGSDFKRGEIEDHYFKRCFEWSDPLDSEFESAALDVFKPIIQNQRKI